MKIIINVYSHGTLWCLKWRGKIVWALFYYFYFALVVCFWECQRPIFFLCLSNGKAPLTKIIIEKVLLMLIFSTNVIKLLCSFVHTSITDFLKVTNYFENTIIDLGYYGIISFELLN